VNIKGKLSLETPSPALPLRFRGRVHKADSGLGFVSLELPYRGWYRGALPAKAGC